MLRHFFATPTNFLDPQLTKDGKPYGPYRYKQIIKEIYFISKNLNTSYTDVRDNMSIPEKREILNIIYEEAQKQKEHLEEMKRQREEKKPPTRMI